MRPATAPRPWSRTTCGTKRRAAGFRGQTVGANDAQLDDVLESCCGERARIACDGSTMDVTLHFVRVERGSRRGRAHGHHLYKVRAVQARRPRVFFTKAALGAVAVRIGADKRASGRRSAWY